MPFLKMQKWKQEELLRQQVPTEQLCKYRYNKIWLIKKVLKINEGKYL